ncbi:MAG: holo-ACP synthase [Candidatus Desulfofervidaceae bacterium]|nr:holo-ACP synthase [Candidatus Desulfofervidaceae bacterium]MDL1969611.1 holo-ACP synthase [Candidatus Desulfofervidaceae bacterium]
MVYGIGIDIVHIPRIKRMWERWQERFLRHIFTQTEVDYCLRKKLFYYELAARVAAKEAFAKAVGLGWRQGLKWRDVEVVNLITGQPILNLYNRAREICEQAGVKASFVSLTHDEEYAIAVIVLEK